MAGAKCCCQAWSSRHLHTAAGILWCDVVHFDESGLILCCFAGVYFEKYVKGKLGQTLWIRNLQLSIYGVPLSLAYTYLKDGK